PPHVALVFQRRVWPCQAVAVPASTRRNAADCRVSRFFRRKFSMVQITLPDGSQRQFPGPVTVAEVAQSIGTGLAKAALGGRITVADDKPRLVDTSYRLEQDAELAIV